MEPLVGYRFHPTDEELINHYLTHKILGNNTWILHQAMNEIDIYKFDPWELRSQSKISSGDPVWYFFSRRDTTNPKKKGTKRTTNSGYWKATGVDRKIRGKGNSGEIGVKKTLVFYLGKTPKGVWTPYVMHEYHSLLLTPEQRTYVICKVKFKGEDADIPSGSGSEPSHSMASNLNNFEDMSTGPEVHQEYQGTPESFYGFSENDMMMPMNDQVGLSLSEVQSLNQFGGNSNSQLQTYYWTQNGNELTSSPMDNDQEYWRSVFGDPDAALYKLQGDCNNYRPRKALTRVYVDSGSDSDPESISATSYQETASPVNSVGSLNGHYKTDANEIESLENLKDLMPTMEYPTGRYTLESQSQPKHSRGGEKHEQPTRSPLLGKFHRVARSKQEVENVMRGDAPSKYERELKMAQDRNKKTSLMVMTGKEDYWFVLQDAIDERSRKHPTYIYLSNTIVGFILFVALIYGIISVR